VTAYGRVGDVLRAQGDLAGALTAYQNRLAISERLAKVDPSNAWQRRLETSIGKIGAMAYVFVLAHDFAKALEAADQAISLAPEKIWIHANRAYALTFLGRVDEARTLYLRYRGMEDAGGGKSWQEIVLADIAEMRKAGLAHPLMDEVEEVFARSKTGEHGPAQSQQSAGPRPEQVAR
jgi:tetratricopeptide (TPR) repeat protein